jgi:hypothetical protein
MASQPQHLPVDHDVLGRIFDLSSSMDTIASLALTCKTAYEVFCQHPIAIKRATAYNIVGSALPQAIRLVRFKSKYLSDSNEECDGDHLCELEGSELPPENIDLEDLSISNADLRSLEEIEKVVQNIENLFSIRQVSSYLF